MNAVLTRFLKLKRNCCDILKLGKVIGNVVATVKDPGLEGLRFLVIQGLDDNFQPIGKPYIAADGIFTAGEGDIVYIVSKKEAAIAIPRELVPIDECVVGYVEEYTVVEAAKKKPKPIKEKVEITSEELETKKPPMKRPTRRRSPRKTTVKTKIPQDKRISEHEMQ
ncbi:MAG: EutN/CcmL family microcompartment protein [Candidatus Hodarchaeota archaeon]